ncbi:MAG TPA: hypothetical protein VGC76_06130 [Pyrinomonadaceae bacterium]
MKKLIQITAILSLLVVFSAVSAKAQTVSIYRTNIPFDFNVGGKSYQAGSYVIKTARLSANCASLTLEDEKGDKLQTILVAARGETSKKQPELVFNRYDSRRFLTKILTGDARISIAMSRVERRTAKKMQEKIPSTQVALAEIK